MSKQPKAFEEAVSYRSANIIRRIFKAIAACWTPPDKPITLIVVSKEIAALLAPHMERAYLEDYHIIQSVDDDGNTSFTLLNEDWHETYGIKDSKA